MLAAYILHMVFILLTTELTEHFAQDHHNRTERLINSYIFESTNYHHLAVDVRIIYINVRYIGHNT